jgi:hypothetical protein
LMGAAVIVSAMQSAEAKSFFISHLIVSAQATRIPTLSVVVSDQKRWKSTSTSGFTHMHESECANPQALDRECR